MGIVLSPPPLATLGGDITLRRYGELDSSQRHGGSLAMFLPIRYVNLEFYEKIEELCFCR